METSNLNTSYVSLHGASSSCIPWLVVSATECLVIIILNLFTIIVFLKQHHLQRPSTFLIIHVAIVDLLTGVVSGPLIVNHLLGLYCDLWKQTDTFYPLAKLFPITSIVNLAVVSLERIHATIFPFEHRVIKRRVYGMVVAAIWFLTSLRETVDFVLYKTQGSSHLAISFQTITMVSFGALSLIVISVSYISIFIKVRFSPNPRHHGVTDRERKLTATLLIVTLASLLTWLSVTTFRIVVYWHEGVRLGWYSQQFSFHITMTLAALVGVNSLVNPIVYAMRMPEFREVIVQMFRRAPTEHVELIYL